MSKILMNITQSLRLNALLMTNKYNMLRYAYEVLPELLQVKIKLQYSCRITLTFI